MTARRYLGTEYRDKVSGFVGIAVAVTEWLNGCVRVTLAPKVDKDGKLPDNMAFDCEQLEPTGGGLSIEPKPTGGDRTTPTRQKDPVR
jgi:hypothetical protein